MIPNYAKSAIERCFEQLGVDVLYCPTLGEVRPIRVIAKQPDAQISFHETRLLNATHLFEIRTEECPRPTRGDRIQLEGETFIIQHVESHDSLRLVWTVEAVNVKT